MKNLDLNAYGVSEMSQQEMLSENGGVIYYPPKEGEIPLPWIELDRFTKIVCY